MLILRSLLNTLVPSRLRRLSHSAHRHFVFRRAMQRFLQAPGACTIPGNPLLADLIYGWGNSSWSALDEYLAACIQHALTARGPILECGSGLSTLLVGAVATMQGQRHWALEHNVRWTAKVQRYLNRYHLDAVSLCTSPLKAYGDIWWYDVPPSSLPPDFSLVLCDGPPGNTAGGRYGLVPRMRDRLKPGCIILLDDAAREQERAIAARWQAELGATVQELGTAKPYMKLTVNANHE